MGNQEFKTPQDALAHYGKLGMHWGVRNDGKPGSSRGPAAQKPKPIDVEAFKKGSDEFFKTKSKADLIADGKKKHQEQIDNPFPSRKDEKRQAKADVIQKQANTFGENAATLEAKRDALGGGVLNSVRKASLNSQIAQARQIEADLNKQADQVRNGKLTDNQKLLIGVGAAVAVGGLALYGNKKYNDHKHGLTSDKKQELHAVNHAKTNEQWRSIFGKDHPSQKASGYYTATNGLMGFHHTLTTKSAWDIPEFTIPKDTVFQRLSNNPEDVSEYGNGRGSYATFLHNDKKMYGASSEFGMSKYTINFHPKEDVRVASLGTVMSHLAMIKEHETGIKYNESNLSQEYYNMAGGGWKQGTSVKLLDSLKSAGYGAIVDHMDAGFMGDLPVVFFGDAHRGTATPRTSADHYVDNSGLLKVGAQYK